MWGKIQPSAAPPLDWERIGDSHFDESKNFVPTYRLKVPGGWLVLMWFPIGNGNTTFVPDSEHKWEGAPLP